ncbi:hypothetical protein ASPWEDRAFT_41204 [Aspergillus wentii DTO 134E9]|uniref:Uncharacterized protein n=1 Tax=Aspergillus wentii DTO 134E9 TaxID=1073089 RepID=A0A1L9RM29_ASPWE|nr:uncharacterized protein ASPWEDRAFT_41204 [Aspergillus wentii DTO 134E9]KAI9929579.1 hypothetical protein MW887_001052 [Aspergillus wentii]OJJ35981.1 hypothetical protein ASPWEDRAFT_41204 [Aspergillus wentii DTO 134E9]
MLVLSFALFLLSAVQSSTAALTESNLEKKVDVLALKNSFNPVKEAYWTGYPHHRRTPFAVSPDGKSAYIAYLDSSETDVHVQQLDPSSFEATGTAVTVTGGKEAGGLVAHDDGFALLTNEAMPSGTTNAPPSDTPVPVLYRYTDGEQTWKTWLGGPGVHESDGLSASPDMNGDLVYSEEAGLYGAYFVVTDYSGDASGHYGDSIEYVSKNGTLETIEGATSSWGCSHNTGIAFEAADAAPFASICAEDQGAIWLNTKTQGMTTDGVKISNENTTNGADGEPMGGMSGSYSGLARFAGSTRYIFSWVSRGAIDLTENEWMGSGYTNAQNRTNNRNVAISLFSDKYTKVGSQASSKVGAEDGDSQVNWITEGSNDCSNAHVATFGTGNALVTWEEISDPVCDFIAMGCRGEFAGSFFQQVDPDGSKVGEPIKSTDAYVAGDMVTMSDGRICWPYVSMAWDLSQPVAALSVSTTKKMSFACISLDGSSSNTTTESSKAAVTETTSVASKSTVETPTTLMTKARVSSTGTPAESSAGSVSEILPTAEAQNAPSTTPTPEAAAPPASSCGDILPQSSSTPIASNTPSPQPTSWFPGWWPNWDFTRPAAGNWGF